MNATADRPRSKSLSPLRALVPFVRPYRAMMAGALLALLVASVSLLALPVALRQLIDHGLAAKDAGADVTPTPPEAPIKPTPPGPVQPAIPAK